MEKMNIDSATPLSSSLSPNNNNNNNNNNNDNSGLSPNSSSISSSSSPPGQVVASPCAACKILRRRCSAERCVLAPYFPPTDPLKFTTAHRVFGASNIIKFLQELPESQREDAVSSMVYEANARVRDPVYGCAGVICHLQNQISDLQTQLAKAQAQVVTMQSQQANLMALICMEMSQSPQSSTSLHHQQQQPQQLYEDNFIVNSPQSLNDVFFFDENSLGPMSDCLWA